MCPLTGASIECNTMQSAALIRGKVSEGACGSRTLTRRCCLRMRPAHFSFWQLLKCIQANGGNHKLRSKRMRWRWVITPGMHRVLKVAFFPSKWRPGCYLPKEKGFLAVMCVCQKCASHITCRAVAAHLSVGNCMTWIPPDNVLYSVSHWFFSLNGIWHLICHWTKSLPSHTEWIMQPKNNTHKIVLFTPHIHISTHLEALPAVSSLWLHNHLIDLIMTLMRRSCCCLASWGPFTQCAAIRKEENEVLKYFTPHCIRRGWELQMCLPRSCIVDSNDGFQKEVFIMRKWMNKTNVLTCTSQKTVKEVKGRVNGCLSICLPPLAGDQSCCPKSTGKGIKNKNRYKYK